MHNIKYVVYHLVFLILVYIVFALVTGHNIDPGEGNLMNWDVTHYNSIRTIGYYFTPDFESNVAFFPGFPYLWKFLGLNGYGISLLNMVMFYTSLLLLAHYFALRPKELLLTLSIPSMMFMYVPYSEALFFLFSAFLLIGLKKENQWLIVFSFFACSITRSAANIFLPAIIIMTVIGQTKNNRWVNMALYAVASLAGIVIVSFIQHAQTGAWFGFIQTQKHWQHKLSLPTLPFWTWGDVLRLDGGTLITGLIAVGIVVYYIWRWLKYKEYFADKALLFSFLYLAGVTLLALIFKQGGLFSLNRYFFPTAFFVPFLPFVLRKAPASGKQLAYIFGAVFLFSDLFINGSLNPFKIFEHIQTFLKFIGFVIYIFGFFLIYHHSKALRNIAFGGVYVTGVIIQVYFFLQFIDCYWVG